MSQRKDSAQAIPPADLDAAFVKVLGYLNFSGGKADSAFLAALNQVAASVGFSDSWAPLRSALHERLQSLRADNPAFSDSSQAEAAIGCVFDTLVPAYLEFHADLLFHLDPVELQNPFFLGRCFEAALEAGGPWDEPGRIVDEALVRLNDYVGYRPIAVLEDGRKMTPYSHERFRPLPLFIAGAGVSSGPHQAIVERALELMASVPPEVVGGAYFDLDRLDELSLDVRAYDHDHPAFKRTNYLFGEWDPHLIDNSGYYRRFVIRKIILDALVDWVAAQKNKVEAIFDAGSVLCGTMLMASSISGDGPATHDSTISLTALLPLVARQRDDFYLRLMQSVGGARAKRLLTRSADAATIRPRGSAEPCIWPITEHARFSIGRWHRSMPAWGTPRLLANRPRSSRRHQLALNARFSAASPRRRSIWNAAIWNLPTKCCVRPNTC